MTFTYCPKCGGRDLSICATVDADVTFDEDGEHEVTDCPTGDIEWDSNHTTMCRSCGFVDALFAFEWAEPFQPKAEATKFHFATSDNPYLTYMQILIDLRDWHAEHGSYPEFTVAEGQCFDDWAADLAQHILNGGQPPVMPYD